ncbi:uncharacterized protein LOC135139845 isoform X2 [Zophobas morio]|uniref:uncharacterized protein LOC135139845 isoform X2 n=1 Tax=Zophobas morio TaxID=2755281 RepID=UPI003082B6FE
MCAPINEPYSLNAANELETEHPEVGYKEAGFLRLSKKKKTTAGGDRAATTRRKLSLADIAGIAPEALSLVPLIAGLTSSGGNEDEGTSLKILSQLLQNYQSQNFEAASVNDEEKEKNVNAELLGQILRLYREQENKNIASGDEPNEEVDGLNANLLDYLERYFPLLTLLASELNSLNALETLVESTA